MDGNTGRARPLAAAIASHDNGFNLVRLTCALLVVVFHGYQFNAAHPGVRDPLSALMAPLTDLGALAVGVFFIISGLFITHSWERDPHLLRFLARRAARILPGLFICLLLTTVVAVVFFSEQGAAGLRDSAPWRFIFGSTVLHQLVYHIPPSELRIAGVLNGEFLNGPLWTLYWEGRMYIMVALIGMAAMLPMRTWLRGAAIFLLLATHLFPDVLAGYIWETRLWSMFLAGMLLCTLAATVHINWRHVACAAALLALNWTRNSELTPSAMTFFGIALVAASAALAAGCATLRWMHWRNDYSYGVYIWHWPVLVMLRAALPPLDGPAMVAAGMAVTVPLAMLSWHLVELPAQRLARRWLRPPSPPATAVASLNKIA